MQTVFIPRAKTVLTARAASEISKDWLYFGPHLDFQAYDPTLNKMSLRNQRQTEACAYKVPRFPIPFAIPSAAARLLHTKSVN